MLERPRLGGRCTRADVAAQLASAWVTADTGSHSAKARRGPGRSSAGTKVFATSVSGKMTMNEALLMTSGLGTSNAT